MVALYYYDPRCALDAGAALAAGRAAPEPERAAGRAALPEECSYLCHRTRV